MTGSMLDKIRSAESLPSLPAVAVEVLRLARSDQSSVADIARVLENDPTLTSRILKVANSALFGMPRQVTSMRQAVVVLGLRTVKVMALTFSLVDSAKRAAEGGFDYQGYWRRSLTTAVAARLLTGQVRPSQADEAFVTGLLCDLGQLAAFHADREAYGRVLAEAARTGEAVHAVEQRCLGLTHEVFSGHLLDSWGLPEGMVAAITRHHQDPDEIVASTLRTDDLLPRIAAAALIAEVFCSPSGAGQLASVTAQIPRLVPMSEAQLQQTLSTLQEKVEEMASGWAIEIGQTRSYKDIQAEAVVQLARLTMAAELERAQLVARQQELRDQNRNLAEKAATDGLTGIANRVRLEEHLQDVCRIAGGRGLRVGMLLLDIDWFKKLNDTFGHQAGDAGLRRVGEYLRRLNGERCLTARYGGEEFAIVLTDTTLQELRELAERVRRDIEQFRIAVGAKTVGLTVSIGGAILGGDEARPSPTQLIALADSHLYRAKQGGRNRAVCADAVAVAEDRPAARPERSLVTLLN